jgi:hypothetical protein
VWNRWFDEVFPPTPPSSSDEDEDEDEALAVVQVVDEEEEEAAAKKRKASTASVMYSASEVEVYPVTQGEEDEEGVKVTMKRSLGFMHAN